MNTGPARSRGAALIAAGLSALLPGAGHLYLGRRRTGGLLIAFSAIAALPAALLVLSLFVISGYRFAASIAQPFLDHPGLLIGLLILNAGLLAFRAATVIDAYRIALDTRDERPGGWQLVAVATVGALIALVVAAPHAWAARRNLALYDLVTYDFTADPGFGGVPTTEAATTTSTSTTMPATTTSTTSGDPFDPVTTSSTTSSTTTTTSTTTTLPPPVIGGDDRLTVALLGGDAGRGRVGIRTDTIIVVSTDLATGDTAMFSVPRNFQELPIPEGHPAHDLWGCGCLPGLANTIYPEGLAYPDRFPGGPNPGINAIKTIIGHLLGLEIDHVVLVALDGFVELIDALGGVDITVVKPVNDPKQVQPDGSLMDVVIPAGDYHFDGQMALAYARVRQQDSDYFRMDRQRCLLEAVAEQLDAVTILQRLPDISAVARSSLVMDLRIADLTAMIDIVERVDTDRVVSMRFVPSAPDLAGTPDSYALRSPSTGRYPVANVELIRERVRIAIEQPPEDALVSLNVSSLDAACSVP